MICNAPLKIQSQSRKARARGAYQSERSETYARAHQGASGTEGEEKAKESGLQRRVPWPSAFRCARSALPPRPHP
eukprot:CAMPEP_0183359530 /NCGR_PEP_ID=MMETSP0164_2-20130417/52495_1 /TAXON_ID=221442 /ORGANISM="Coccolithus pelagicus ssp braarudi, Strain PLY182g" /LENGTH=74 /DNA_ID=CAMNT_0025533667 /DNA_START=145 /DNA_END=366 /DNA_ORIENTATION=-